MFVVDALELVVESIAIRALHELSVPTERFDEVVLTHFFCFFPPPPFVFFKSKYRLVCLALLRK